MHIEDLENLRYFCMVYNALRSLFKFYDHSFDVLVFYTFPENLEQFYHNEKFNLVKDFPLVQFIESDYIKKYNTNRQRPYRHDGYMSKWYHLQKSFELGYSKVFFLDCDTIFMKNPGYLFEKYSDGNLWTLSCSDPVHDKLFPDMPNMNSGQFMLDINCIQNVSTLYESIVNKRMWLSNLARTELFDKGLISDGELSGYDYFNEQYCGQMVILENEDVSYENFDYIEIIHPASPVEFAYDGNIVQSPNDSLYSVNLNSSGIVGIFNINANTCIIHYSSGKSVFWVDKELRNKDLSDGYDRMYRILKNKNYNNTWELLFK
jgi:hypothetical protein